MLDIIPLVEYKLVAAFHVRTRQTLVDNNDGIFM